MSKKVLVTGAAGFIGFHLVEKLLTQGHAVVGLDNINDYYDPQLKLARLQAAGVGAESLTWFTQVVSTLHPQYRFTRINLEDKQQLLKLFATEKFDEVVHLAAQAGVRYSIHNPDVYVQSNVVGFLNVLEACRHHNIAHLIYASSSSVYGMNAKMPFSVGDNVDYPVSLYAASKRSNELMAHAYSHLYGLRTTGLRFFTVYGPWGRPDMAAFLFANAIAKGEPIKVFNHGKLRRDFTYVDDIVDGVASVLADQSNYNSSITAAPSLPSGQNPNYRLYNIGNNQPVELLTFIRQMEQYFDRPAILEMMPMQPGDVLATWADVADLQNQFNYRPDTNIEEGLKQYVAWHKAYYKTSTKEGL